MNLEQVAVKLRKLMAGRTVKTVELEGSVLHISFTDGGPDVCFPATKLEVLEELQPDKTLEDRRTAVQKAAEEGFSGKK